MITPTLAICVQRSDSNCAHVLYRLIWWVSRYPEKTKDGYRWNANPTSWWSQQTGLSPTQVDRAIAKLKKSKLIIVECRPRGQLLKCRWMRLSDEFEQTILANLQSGPSDDAEMGSTSIGETIPAASLEPSKGTSKGMLKDSIPDLSGGHNASPKTGQNAKILSVKGLQELWRTEVGKSTGHWVADFNSGELKFASELIKKTAGQDLAFAVTKVASDWAGFREFVKDAKGISSSKIAELPQIFTLMVHTTELIAFAKKPTVDECEDPWSAKSKK
jgi:hypothetical protein